jgi:hypothetical protein
MNMDRAELAGTGAALAFHVALIAAMSLSLAHVARTPETPAMEVELVEDVGLQSAAPAATPPPSQAPEIGEAPVVEPTPAPAVVPVTPSLRVMPAPAKPQKPAPAAKPAPRVSRIGDDFLKGIADAPATAKAVPAAAKFDARAKSSIAQLIADQIRPCALRQRDLGPGANRIQVVLNLQLLPSGRLKRSPTVLSRSGVDDENAQYADLVENQAIASYRQCSPLRLPAELYQTPEGGWANINMKYRVP